MRNAHTLFYLFSVKRGIKYSNRNDTVDNSDLIFMNKIEQIASDTNVSGTIKETKELYQEHRS